MKTEESAYTMSTFNIPHKLVSKDDDWNGPTSRLWESTLLKPPFVNISFSKLQKIFFFIVNIYLITNLLQEKSQLLSFLRPPLENILG